MNYGRMLLLDYIISLWNLPRYKIFITKNEILEIFDTLANERSDYAAFASKVKAEINDYILTWYPSEIVRLSEFEHDLMAFCQGGKNVK